MDDNRFHAEESLEKRLADAYESMGPDEEARRRMLAELLAASERRAPKRRTARRALVPLAACLALAAGIGVFTYASSLPQPPSSSGMAALTSINDELKSAAPAASDESQSESGAAPSDGDARYPFVTLSSGELLRVALGDDGPLPPAPKPSEKNWSAPSPPAPTKRHPRRARCSRRATRPTLTPSDTTKTASRTWPTPRKPDERRTSCTLPTAAAAGSPRAPSPSPS